MVRWSTGWDLRNYTSAPSVVSSKQDQSIVAAIAYICEHGLNRFIFSNPECPQTSVGLILKWGLFEEFFETVLIKMQTFGIVGLLHTLYHESTGNCNIKHTIFIYSINHEYRRKQWASPWLLSDFDVVFSASARFLSFILMTVDLFACKTRRPMSRHQLWCVPWMWNQNWRDPACLKRPAHVTVFLENSAL